jgi:hypothetical protein
VLKKQTKEEIETQEDEADEFVVIVVNYWKS